MPAKHNAIPTAAQVKAARKALLKKHGPRLEKRRRLARVAQATPAPGALREAFAAFPTNIHGRTLLPLTASHVIILQQIGSPFMEAVKIGLNGDLSATEKKKAAAAVPNTHPVEDAAEVLFVFTSAPAVLREALRGGRDMFRKVALAATLDKLPPLVNWENVSQLLATHFIHSFATALEHEVDTGGGDGSFPSEPPTTASAGS